ncbi:hypothetical protein [Oceanobacillus senegalensis]|uniref:hypothetical protein n=1 Tax=Oceanobacillus senegalensis TaxID=1936063 RepID=UPI000A3098EE|nr:hypothetical protein [Oceanobacillus senegalensis]
MKKHKVVYRFCRYEGTAFYARKEIPYEFSFQAQLILDEICFNWNKQKLLDNIHYSLEKGNKEDFITYSQSYQEYVWES